MDFWVKSTDHLWNSAIISFVDQKYWCHKIILKNYPEGKVIPKPNQYRHIFIDEFQDINPLDLKLIKELVRVNEANLTIVGDDDQAIFEWRGSTPNFIVNPSKFFAGTFEDHLLTRNYRSPKNIVQKSLELIANNKNRVSKSTYPENKNTAIIEVKRFKNQADYLEDILKFCEQINAQENPETLAILCRKKSQIIPIQILLTARDIPFFAKEDLNVFLSIAFKDLKEILLILSEKNSRRNYKDIIDDIILLINYVPTYPLNKKDAKALRHFLREQRKGFKTTQQALETLFKYDGPKLDKKSKNTGDIILDFYQGISEVFNSQSVSEALTAAGEHFAGLKKHYAKSEEDIYYKDPPFSFLIDYASQYDDNFEDFIDHLEDAIIQMEDQVAEESIDDDIKLPIHIMTALRAKGKEFDNVILLDVIDDIWPSRLSETEMEFEQERRVFYVAVTRAKKALYLYQTENLFGRPVSPSRYISELGL
jgi:DNA helicase-2/ATP-dependent DNA helicase PcrA